MTHPSLKRGTAFAAAAAVGFSTLLLGAVPAQAAPATCAYGATLIGSDVCELTVTDTAPTTIVPTEEMGTLEALLVGGGGDGGKLPKTQDDYGFLGGGGGEVRVVGFDAETSAPLTVAVGPAGTQTSVAQGAITEIARPGIAGLSGGVSGTGFTPLEPNNYESAAGAGAGGRPPALYYGGPGLTPSAVAGAGSLFADATDTCYGGGGAAVDSASNSATTAPCGGGTFVRGGPYENTAVAARPNTGGGGIGAHSATEGASGVVVLRWSVLAAPTASVTFDMQGHGDQVAEQLVTLRETPVEPTAPTATGFRFTGWFYDAQLTEPADFSAPISDPVTLFAGWVVIPEVTPEPTAPATTPPTPEPTATATALPAPSATPEDSASPVITVSPEVSPVTPADTDTGALAQTGADRSGPLGVMGAAVIAAGLAIAGFASRLARRRA